MKQRKRLCSLLVLVLFCMAMMPVKAEKASGTVYYVSASEGDDANDGLSEKSPIQSMEKVSELKLSAGDQVLFKSGDIWYGTITLDASCGEKENPIIFSSYGEGKQPSLRHYTGRVLEGGVTNVMVLKNANGVEIKNLDFGWSNAGVRLEYDTRGHEYVKFESCHFHDIYGTHQYNQLPELDFSAAIYTDTKVMDNTTFEADGYPLEGLYIERCTAYDGGALSGYTVGVKGLYVTECVAQNNGYYGAVVTAKGGYIDRCVFDNNGTRPMPAGSCGIMLGAEDFTIKNSIVSNQQRQEGDPDGCGIDFEWANKNITIDNVLFEGNAGVSVMFFTSGNNGDLGENIGTNYDCVIKNCKFVNNNTNIGNIGGYEIFSVNAGADRSVIENCEYVIDYATSTETVDWYLCTGESNIEFTNVEMVDTIDEDYNPLASGMDGAKAEGKAGLPDYLWLVFGAVEGIVLVGGVILVSKLVNKKKGAVGNEE